MKTGVLSIQFPEDFLKTKPFEKDNYPQAYSALTFINNIRTKKYCSD